MKAVECTRYGPPEVLHVIETAIPVPGNNEMQIAVKASAVTASDIFIRSSAIPVQYMIPMRIMIGITRPRRSILGLVYAGVVEAVGSEITRFSVGDRVFGMTGFRFGAYAEYMCVTETDSKTGCAAALPESISFVNATAAAYGGSLALQYMDMGHIQPGQRILVYGASGTSGTMAVQYGKYLGAHVTAVCGTHNQALATSLGADEVVDYMTTDHLDADAAYDFILDSVGKMKKSKLKENCRRSLKPGGKYVSIDNGDLILSASRLDKISELVVAGALRPVIDTTYTLDQIVAAHRYVQNGHKRGGVAISVQQ
jgi:NADPH:quinone reductase-like Zn-dependent oxidoreductase